MPSARFWSICAVAIGTTRRYSWPTCRRHFRRRSMPTKAVGMKSNRTSPRCCLTTSEIRITSSIQRSTTYRLFQRSWIGCLSSDPSLSSLENRDLSGHNQGKWHSATRLSTYCDHSQPDGHAGPVPVRNLINTLLREGRIDRDTKISEIRPRTQ